MRIFLAKYLYPLWSPPGSVEGAPDAGGGGEAPAPAGGTGGEAAPVDAGGTDTSFVLNEDNVFGDHDDPQEAGGGQATPPQPAKEGAPSDGAPKPTAAPVAAPAAVKPAAAAPPAPAQTQQPAQTQPVAQEATPQPTTARAAGPMSGPELVAALQQNRETMISAIADQQYKLSEKDLQELDTDAAAFIPKLLARAHYNAAINTIQQISNMVPRIVEAVTSSRIVENEAVNEFKTAWPNIDQEDDNHMKVVNTLANTYRQMNPTASRQDAIRYVGEAATAFLQLQRPANSAPATAGAPARRANGGQQPRGPAPFTPASGGAPVPVNNAPQPGDMFAGMGLQLDDS